ncbi:MAG: helical backbone metal receptor [Chitinophagaceae bacterium]
MPFFTDQTGRQISLEQNPVRIISLVPSQTELLYHLGLDEEVIGITKFCVHPNEWFRNKTRIGGTKQIHIDAVHRLQPDFILANKEENVKDQVETLERDFPVWVSDVNTLEDACSMIRSIGEITGKAEPAMNMALRIQQQFELLELSFDKSKAPLHTAYLIWKDPYMTIGNDTFIHDMLTRCGLENIFASQKRYPVVSIEQLRAEADISRLQLLLLSSEPYPFAQKHLEELQPLLPGIKIMLADGEMFSWYGSRLLQAPAYFQKLREMI